MPYLQVELIYIPLQCPQRRSDSSRLYPQRNRASPGSVRSSAFVNALSHDSIGVQALAPVHDQKAYFIVPGCRLYVRIASSEQLRV